MVDSPLISVITPIHTTSHKLPKIRKALATSSTPIQLIIVLNNPQLTEMIKPQNSNELVVVAPRKGRGYAFLEGITRIDGNVTMLLHSDTIPPLGWEKAILAALKNPQVVGGGFSMTHDRPNPYLELGVWCLNQWFRVSGELYGDRAMFIRSNILRRCLSTLEVPLFEDLRLSLCMQKYGRVVLLKEKVETRAASLREYGFFRYFANFYLCRIWYALGGPPFQIYNAYYSSTKK